MEIKQMVQYRAETKEKTKITLTSKGVKVKLAPKDIKYETEILEYAKDFRRRVLYRIGTDKSIKLVVNYINGSVYRYKNVKLISCPKYDGFALRHVMENK